MNSQASVFVSYSSNCTIKPHVRFHIEALAARGFKVILIVNVDGFDKKQRLQKCDAAVGMVVRGNAGFDFGAWADAFRLFPTLWTAESVLLVNDSVFGPFGDFDAALASVRTAPADVVGLTDSYEISHHMQSYFTLMKKPALLNQAVRKFWRLITNLATKQLVIRRYEIEMYPRYESYGLSCSALYPCDPDYIGNPTMFRWRELVHKGFPFIKVHLLRNKNGEYNLTGWSEAITNPALLAAIQAEIGSLPEVNQDSARRSTSGGEASSAGNRTPQ